MISLSAPDAFDFDLLVDTLHKLKEGKHVDVPIYDFVTHCRAKYTVSECSSYNAVFIYIICICTYMCVFL